MCVCVSEKVLGKTKIQTTDKISSLFQNVFIRFLEKKTKYNFEPVDCVSVYQLPAYSFHILSNLPM